MARINLLPWREERRKQRQRQFNLTAVMVGVFGGFTVFVLWGAMNEALSNQDARNNYLTDQVKLMDDRIAQIKDLQDTKQRLLARMQIIQTLQQSRPTEVHLFDQLVETLPPGVYLKSVVQTGTHLQVTGVAESSARVSTYLRNIDSSSWLGSPNLEIVQKDSAKNGSQQFSISANVVDKAAQQAADSDKNGGGDK